MTLSEENKMLKDLIKNAFSIDFNMNDTWAYACADSQEIDGHAVFDLIPYIEKYGVHDSINALSSVFLEVEDGEIIHPIKPVDTEEYRNARKDIIAELDDPERNTFFYLRYNRDDKKKHLEKYGEEVLRWGIAKKPGLQAIILELKEKGIFGIGTNQVGAFKDLDEKFENYKVEKK